MSALFNYSKIKDTVNFDGMLPGQKSRTTEIDVQYACLIHPNEYNEEKKYVENGEVVGLYRDSDDNGNSTLYCVDGTTEEFTSALQMGIVLADVRGQIERYAGPNFIYKHPVNSTVTVMTQGYVWVPVQDDGTISSGSKVYTDKKGGILTTALTAQGEEGEDEVELTIEIPNAKFTGLYGFPLSSKQDGTDGAKLTGKTAEICLGVNLI